MNFNQPNLVLIRNQNDEYILHATTFYNKMNYRVLGPSPSVDTVNVEIRLTAEERVIEVDLVVIEESAYLPKVISPGSGEDFQALTTFVHVINLGTLPGVNLSEDNELDAEVTGTIQFEDPGSGDRRHGGRGKQRRVSAGGGYKPYPFTQGA